MADSAEADDCSSESQENTIITTSEFSATDQTTGTGSETEVIPCLFQYVSSLDL